MLYNSKTGAVVEIKKEHIKYDHIHNEISAESGSHFHIRRNAVEKKEPRTYKGDFLFRLEARAVMK